MTGFVAVGKISAPVGLHGEVRLVRWTDSPERFGHLRHVWIGNDDQQKQEFDVGGVRFAAAGVVLKLVGVETRSAAESLAGKLVLIPGEETVQPAEGSYFIDDVLGMRVVTDEGNDVGVVREVLRLPSNDLWQVEQGSRTISIPAVRAFIRKVDLREKKVVIRAIEGLLDL